MNFLNKIFMVIGVKLIEAIALFSKFKTHKPSVIRLSYSLEISLFFNFIDKRGEGRLRNTQILRNNIHSLGCIIFSQLVNNVNFSIGKVSRKLLVLKGLFFCFLKAVYKAKKDSIIFIVLIHDNLVVIPRF